MSLLTVPVALPERPYDVVVGPGARHRLPAVVPAGARRAAVVTQAAVGVEVETAIEQRTFVLDGGEAAKSVATVEGLCRQFAHWGLNRRDVVVAVGGGVVTDTAGFAAAVYHRGVAVVHVSTTLLGQVDAAIGGKTGVNLPEGKNLVGAFWQPAAVLCDTDVLATLPEREYRSGLGEMAKYAFIDGEAKAFADLPLDERVARCVAIKARYVVADEREDTAALHARPPAGQPQGTSGPQGRSRALLNYGHTLAHALETAGRYDLRHGEAVAIGLVYAAELACLMGRIGSDRVEEHRALVRSYDLPERVPGTFGDTGALLDLMARDKKAVDGLTFVLDGPAGLEVVRGVSRGDAWHALERVL
jgi:5-deoxy-5-amino-3-dehydroquinate synthase